MKQQFNYRLKHLCTYTSILVIFLLFFHPLYIFAEIVDKVVVVVNDEVITLSELEEQAQPMYQAVAKSNLDKPLEEALAEVREMTLNRMIDQKLIAQRAKEYNITVSEEEIDDAFAAMQEKFALSPGELKIKLEESGMTEESYRDQLRSQILQNKLLSYDVRSKIVITEDMILDYYDENYTSRVDKGSLYLLQMGFNWDKQNSDPAKLAAAKQDALQRAERVAELVADGQDFRTLAKKFSDLPSASDGGDIGSFDLEDMAPAMRKALGSLEPGDVSEIIETPSGYQFFKLLSSEENDIIVTASFEEVKEEIKEKLYEEKLKEAFSDWVRKLKEDAHIQKL
ncbi:MAG: SurA N-terminal domain-containing protein [Desulforhopalus sp.]